MVENTINSISSISPVNKASQVLKVQKPVQDRLQQISTPVPKEETDDFAVEISELSKRIKELSSDVDKRVAEIAEYLVNVTERNSVQGMYNYGKSDKELLEEKMGPFIEKEMPNNPEMNDKNKEIPKNTENNREPTFREISRIIDAESSGIGGNEISDFLDGLQSANKFSEQDQYKSIFAEKRNNDIMSDSAKAFKKFEDLREITGQLGNMREILTGKENTNIQTQAEKANEMLGDRITKQGVAAEEKRKITPKERIERRLENLDQKTGELIDKPKEMTGTEKTDNLSPAQKMNEQLGNKIDRTGVKDDSEREDYQTPVEKAEQRMANLEMTTGSLVEKHPALTGDQIEENLHEGKGTYKHISDAEKAQKAYGKTVITEDELTRFVSVTELSGEDKEKITGKISQLSEEDQDVVKDIVNKLKENKRDTFFDAFAKLEDKSLQNFLATTKEMTDAGGEPNVDKFLSIVSLSEREPHMGKTDLDRFLESANERTGIERTMFLMSRYSQAFD